MKALQVENRASAFSKYVSALHSQKASEEDDKEVEDDFFDGMNRTLTRHKHIKSLYLFKKSKEVIKRKQK